MGLDRGRDQGKLPDRLLKITLARGHRCAGPGGAGAQAELRVDYAAVVQGWKGGGVAVTPPGTVLSAAVCVMPASACWHSWASDKQQGFLLPAS